MSLISNRLIAINSIFSIDTNNNIVGGEVEPYVRTVLQYR
jgi:hypothetical protein